MAPTDELAELGPRDARPTPNPEIDVADHRLSPVEAFVLSRVDGGTSYGDICQITGLGAEPTLAILRKLRRERLILNPGEKAELVPPVPKPSSPPGSTARPRTRTGGLAVPPSLLEFHDDGSPVDAAELALGPGLDVETKARILRLHRRLRGLKPHELLALAPGAEPALIKRAYFAAAKEVHPDRHYGQDIGPYRDKLSDIFAHLTQAFEHCKQSGKEGGHEAKDGGKGK